MNTMSSNNKFIVTEPANVMGIVKLTEKDDNFLVGVNDWVFPKKNILTLFVEIGDKQGRILGFLNNEKYVSISEDMYKVALKTYNAFTQSSKKYLEVFAFKKDSPVLICNGEGVGFILAPRIED